MHGFRFEYSNAFTALLVYMLPFEVCINLAVHVRFSNYSAWIIWCQTHTQVERKIMEGKREALFRKASESSSVGSTLQEKLTELDSIKPRPYGSLQAVCIQFFHLSSHAYNI